MTDTIKWNFSVTWDVVLNIFSCLVENHHHHHLHVSVMGLGHLLTRSGLTYPEVSSKVCHDSFCQSGSSVSLPWVIYCEAFYLHVVSIFSRIPVICPKLVLFLTPLQFGGKFKTFLESYWSSTCQCALSSFFYIVLSVNVIICGVCTAVTISSFLLQSTLLYPAVLFIKCISTGISLYSSDLQCFNPTGFVHQQV